MNKIFKNFTLLYVEDEEFIREQTRSLLNLFFDNIIVAKDGKEGFDLFMKNKIDLITPFEKSHWSLADGMNRKA